MRPAEAKELVLGLMLGGGLAPADGLSVVDPVSPDGDQAKFLIAGKVARAIHHFDGWYVPIDLGWFAGGYDQPAIHRTPFYWYVFAIPARRRFYCQVLGMRVNEDIDGWIVIGSEPSLRELAFQRATEWVPAPLA